jgi:pyruvate kinase
MISYALDAALERELIHEGDIVVITAGAARSKPGTTNLMRVHMIEQQIPAREHD